MAPSMAPWIANEFFRLRFVETRRFDMLSTENSALSAYRSTGKRYSIQSARGGELVAPHLEVSLARLERAAPERGVSIIDVGGGDRRWLMTSSSEGTGTLPFSIFHQPLLMSRRDDWGAAAQIRWLAGDVT